MPATDNVTVPVELDAQKAYDAAMALTVAWRVFAETLARELEDAICTHPRDMRELMNEHRSFCGLCGRQFVH